LDKRIGFIAEKYYCRYFNIFIFEYAIADPVSQVKEHNPKNILYLGAIAVFLLIKLKLRSRWFLSVIFIPQTFWPAILY
jgi:hypothetical protein